VERFNQFLFFEMGKNFANLAKHEGDVAPLTLIWDFWAAKGTLVALLNGTIIPIGISISKGRELLGAMTELEVAHFTEVDEKGEQQYQFPGPNDRPVQQWRLNYLKRLFSEFEMIFQEEMKETATYYVPRKGIYYTPALVDSADETFPEELLPYIPQKAREDWKAAGRCLAFNLLSASGFHAARAVEAMLEGYYQLFSGKQGKTLNGWADYKDALEKIISGGADPAPQKKTLAELDQMRLDYRNPIMHPRIVLNEADARMLFANGESLIIAMAQEVADATGKGIQASLALVGGSDAKKAEAGKAEG
jgi:hypothetical protein